MAFTFRRFFSGIKIIAKTPLTASGLGDLEVDSVASKLNFHNGTSESPVVTEAHTATLTNKTISGSANTITNIGTSSISPNAITNAQIGSGAALSGTVLQADGAGNSSWSAFTAQVDNTSIDYNGASKLEVKNQGITAAKIASLTITASQISLSAGILGVQIAAGTITGTNIGAATVTTGNIAVPNSSVICDTPNGYGSTNNKIRRWAVGNVISTGTDITFADSATLGSTFTIATAGIYSFSYTDTYSAGLGTLGISVNSNQLTTSILSITTANRIMLTNSPTNTFASVSAVATLAVNDVIRVHTDGLINGASAGSQFRIVRLF